LLEAGTRALAIPLPMTESVTAEAARWSEARNMKHFPSVLRRNAWSAAEGSACWWP
jgi:hypothetical protein